MKRMNRCPACGRQRKKGHEKRVGTPLAYTPQCIRYHKKKKVIEDISVV